MDRPLRLAQKGVESETAADVRTRAPQVVHDFRVGVAGFF
jgi:hypothetical protein